MRDLQVSKLQWAVGAYCIILGVQILVTSQQYNAPGFVPVLLPQADTAGAHELHVR